MKHIVLCFLVLLPGLVFCQKEKTVEGTIPKYGNTYIVNNPDFKTDILNDLKVVFDVGRSFGDSTKLNPLINTAARYLNMHLNANVPEKNLKVALVIHGNAINDVLNNTQYKTRFTIDNPNTPLLSALSDKGVQIIVCGQTAAHRNITKTNVHPDIQIALSAMTALVQLQNKGYKLINF
ncbi:DsrE family protein [Aquimarina sp. RZ0]|uniref:DsrE family protein n=1 Tax=Aquimarina sp. RZ0 TaxID=2607730 RepID=UPI00165F0157|nr:DsrE family protein [Aquimarina sp. RZ0]